MARLSHIDPSHRSARRPGRRAFALVGAIALLLAAGVSVLGGSGPGSVEQSNLADTQAQSNPAVAAVNVTALESSSVAVDASVTALESAAPVATTPVLEIGTAAREEAAAPAASQAIASAPDAAASSVANETLSPVDRWAAQGIRLVMQGEEWDDRSLANVDAALSALPPNLLSSLGNPALGEMQIVVNREGRELSGTQPYGGPANFYSTNDGINELVLYPDQSAFTVLHELGHAYNLRRTPAGRYALVLLDPEMQSFMAATGWHVLSADAQVRAAIDQIGVSYSYDGGFMWSNLSHFDPLEDFANSFAMYFLDPATLNSLSPARYDWFAANIGR